MAKSILEKLMGVSNERPLNGEALRQQKAKAKKKKITDKNKKITARANKNKARKKNRSKTVGKGMKLFPKKKTRKK